MLNTHILKIISYISPENFILWMTQHIRVLPLLFLLLNGCSLTSIVTYSVSGFIGNTFVAINEEQDLVIAEASISSNLKLLDGLLKSAPDDEHYLLLAAQGYTGYALGFVEDENPERARILYNRARMSALSLLQHNKNFAHIMDGSLDALQNALASATRNDVPAIFWTALSWGSELQLSLTDPAVIISFPKIQAMMEFVATTDSAYYFAGANFFLGALYGSRPAMFGGNTVLSKQYFDAALRINEGKFLLTHIYYARFFAAQTLNQELYEQLLTTVDSASIEILPAQRLANAIAKKKALLLRTKINEIF